jgi:uncharacterized protein (TIGR02118 family)
MVILSVLYPKTKDSKFDLEYYLETHIPLVKSRWSEMGLRDVDLVQGTAAVDGGAATYEVIGQLAFDSTESLENALSRHGNEIIADIPNFTNVQPIIQAGKPL